MVPECDGFYGKTNFWISIFFIHVFLFACGNCGMKYNNAEITKLLTTLQNDGELSSFHFYPLNIHLTSHKDGEDEKEIYMNLDNMVLRLRPANTKLAKPKPRTSNKGQLTYDHKMKLEKIISFLKTHYTSTNYFYSEMKRIQNQYQVKDKMRQMIDYLEEPRHYKVKEKILKLYDKLSKVQDVEDNLWEKPTNNLVINVVKDPFNDGVH